MDSTQRRIAIVGSGPSGLFAAKALLDQPGVLVDVYDRLPTPFGLLRYGVAPDHQSIKQIALPLAALFVNPALSFIGTVDFGTDLTREDLLGAYDAVIYAVGASEDRHLHIPGEDLPGSRSAREFVAWYAGHPDAAAISLAGVSVAATVGVGNVAVDVCRILCTPADTLRATDMPEAVLDELRKHRIDDVWLIGRRGPQHASFTTAELRELLTLPGVQPVVHGRIDPLDDQVTDRRTRANLEAIREASHRIVPGSRQRLHLLFWHRPVRIDGQGQVGSLLLERTAPSADQGVVGTGEHLRIDCGLVLRAVGYRARPLPGVPFDDKRGVIPHVEGRVCDLDGTILPREYVVGWIKRGPVGVIGTNKADANQTVAQVTADLAGPRPELAMTPARLWAERGLRPTSWADWERIEEAERGRGRLLGRERITIEGWSELLDIARLGSAGGPPTPGESWDRGSQAVEEVPERVADAVGDAADPVPEFGRQLTGDADDVPADPRQLADQVADPVQQDTVAEKVSQQEEIDAV